MSAEDDTLLPGETAREHNARVHASAEPVDMVNHPPHYTSDPSGVECIEITRHRNFNIGNAIKYLWRAGLKLEVPQMREQFLPAVGLDVSVVPDTLVRQVSVTKQVEDLKKAIFYITDEIGRLEAEEQKRKEQR